MSLFPKKHELLAEELESQLAYWRQQINGVPVVLQLPTFRGANCMLQFSQVLTEALKALSQREGATLFMTLLAAINTLLFRYTWQEDLVVGTPSTGRKHAEPLGPNGSFTNMLALRTNLAGDPPFREVLEQVRKVVLEAYTHQDMPFERPVEEVLPGRELSYNPLFHVMFSFQSDPTPTSDLPELGLQLIEVENETAKFYLSLTLVDTGQGLTGSLEYSTDLFEAATISRIVGHFQTLLEGVVANPKQPISELPLLTEAERHQLIVEWNETRSDYPKDLLIHQLFESQVERTPDVVAVVFEDEHLTYQELNSKANQLARYLLHLGVGPEVLVGLCLERSLEMVIGMLGILKAGGAYVPLDPAYPKERLVFMLEDSQAVVLLTREQLLPLLLEHHVHTVCLDSTWPTIAQELMENLVSPATSKNLAYVIYTSGSTGKPKGVLVTHQNLVHSTVARTTYYEEPVNCFLLLSSFAFDSSVAGIFWTLSQGGVLVLPRADFQSEISYLTKLMAQNQVSHLLGPPALYMLLLEQAKLQQIVSLRTIIVAGEPCPRDLVEHHYQLLSRAQLFNEYGPTEGTVWCSVYNCRSENLRSSVPIGRPIANMQIYLLDTHLQLVPIGVPGELHISGAGLARGYFNHPELTSTKFIAHPFSNEPGARLYKTGDLARYLPDGNIEFLGRIDHQVKIRGFRIELGEIEAVLSQHSAVHQAVVVAREYVPGNKCLEAYVVLRQEQRATVNDLQSHVMKHLPAYMVPSAFVLLEALPLTPNGKVDRKALPAPNATNIARDGAVTMPDTSTEKRLVEIVAALLGLDQVGIDDNIFLIGGNSLMGLQLVAWVAEVFGVELSLRILFNAPTVRRLASEIERLIAAMLEQMSDEELQRLLAQG